MRSPLVLTLRCPNCGASAEEVRVLKDLLVYATARCYEAGESPTRSPLLTAARTILEQWGGR